MSAVHTPLQTLGAYDNWLLFSRALSLRMALLLVSLWISPAVAVTSELGMGSSGGPSGTLARLDSPPPPHLALLRSGDVLFPYGSSACSLCSSVLAAKQLAGRLYPAAQGPKRAAERPCCASVHQTSVVLLSLTSHWPKLLVWPSPGSV